MLRTREQGPLEDRWQLEDVLSSSIYGTAPVPGAAVRPVRKYTMRILAPSHPSGSSELPSPPGSLFERCLLEVDPGQGI